MIPIPDEKAKMLAGELYRANDEALVVARRRAQTLLDQFNALSVNEGAHAQAVLVQLLGALASDAVVLPPFRCDYGFNIAIGARTFLNYDCILLDCNRIDIGEDVLIGPGVHLYTATHPQGVALRRAGVELALPIVIGDGVWLGGRSVVCPGVTIGDNTVVGAGSVVTRNLPPGVIAAGNPCRVIRPL